MSKQKATLFHNMELDYDNYCGIDEAGRGPIAGPLVVAAVKLYEKIEGLNDSKKLSEKKRENLYEIIKNSSKWFIYEVEASKIDKIGLSKAIKESLEEIKKFFKEERDFLFDGNSTFGVNGIKTLIKADTKVASVSAASILAKVYRDKKMVEYDKIYPLYGFKNHKGYGTKTHIEAIKRYGYCKIHRISFKIKQKATKETTLF